MLFRHSCVVWCARARISNVEYGENLAAAHDNSIALIAWCHQWASQTEWLRFSREILTRKTTTVTYCKQRIFRMGIEAQNMEVAGFICFLGILLWCQLLRVFFPLALAAVLDPSNKSSGRRTCVVVALSFILFFFQRKASRMIHHVFLSSCSIDDDERKKDEGLTLFNLHSDRWLAYLFLVRSKRTLNHSFTFRTR